MQAQSDCHSVTNPLEDKFVDLPVFRANVGTLRGSSGEFVEVIEQRSVDICCLLETRFREKSVRIISGKSAQYKLFWTGNGKGLGEVGIFLAKKQVDKVINISRVSDRMIVNKVLVQSIIISLISDSLFMFHNVVQIIARKIIFMTALSILFEGQGRLEFQFQQEALTVTGNNPENYQGQHGYYGYEVRKKEGECIHEICGAMNMTVGNTLFKKRVSH